MEFEERDKLRREAEPLMEALGRAMRAQAKLHAAKEAFEGYSFDYFHRREIEEAENAAIELVYQIKALKP